MQWLMTSNLKTLGDDVMRDAVLRNGGTVKEVELIPMVKDVRGLSPSVVGDEAIPYGSTAFIERCMCSSMPHLFVNEKFDSRVWKYKRDDMLNQRSFEVRLHDVEMYEDIFRNTFASDSPVFIRPPLELKAFNGKVVSLDDLLHWRTSTIFGSFPVNGETLVSISEIREIHTEYRFFIVEGVVVSGSVYRYNGQISPYTVHDTMLVKAQDMANKWLPHRTCVMDIALVAGELKVVEFNCFNASGLYASDVDKIVNAVHSAYSTGN